MVAISDMVGMVSANTSTYHSKKRAKYKQLILKDLRLRGGRPSASHWFIVTYLSYFC